MCYDNVACKIAKFEGSVMWGHLLVNYLSTYTNIGQKQTNKQRNTLFTIN